MDDQSNFSGDVRISEEPSDHINRGKSAMSESGHHALLEQLRESRAEVDMLESRRAELEIYLEEQVREADILTSKIHDLEDQLYQEKKEYKRVNSKIKKFIRAHDRHAELQEELKRSQRQLANLGEQLGHEAVEVGHNEDLSINILSDEELLANKRSSALNSNASQNFKLLGLTRAEAEELRSQDKDYEAMDRQRFGTGKSGDAKHKKDKGLPSVIAAGEKSKVSGIGFIPPTGVAAHVSDELADFDENAEAATSLPSGAVEDTQDVQNSENVDIV